MSWELPLDGTRHVGEVTEEELSSVDHFVASVGALGVSWTVQADLVDYLPDQMFALGAHLLVLAICKLAHELLNDL